MSTSFPLGKLPAHVLARLLSQFKPIDSRVLVGPGIGLDAAVIDLGDRLLVAKSDPITFATDAIGWYAVQVNANDIAAMGATPCWFLATVLLPQSHANAAMAEEILAQVYNACTAIDVSLVGGHTEITYGLDRPIVAGCMVGQVARSQLVTPAGARPNDAILLTKGIAIEGTAILAREQSLAGFDDDFLNRCRRFLTEPGISVVRDAAIATNVGHVHAMHDPTEGGLATGLYEMAHAASVGMLIEASAVPVYSETRALCHALHLDPWGLIASGALLMAVESADADNITRALEAHGIRTANIGRVTEYTGQMQIHDDAKQAVYEVPRFDRDEIARWLEREPSTASEPAEG